MGNGCSSSETDEALRALKQQKVFTNGLSGAGIQCQPGRISAIMELCYMVSMSTLHEVLQSEAKPNTAYRLLASEDTVTVVHYGPEGLINQFAFPIVYRVEDVPEDEGTLMLMVATERSREWQSFWVPLETKLSHCCSLNTVA
jgi:hypothetical protein